MSKKSKKKSKSLSKRIRENTRTIVIVSILIGVFSGVSFYLGIATPHSFETPIALSTSMGLSVDQTFTVKYGSQTGIRITFEVTSNSHDWTLTFYQLDGTPVGSLSGTQSGTFSTDSWYYSPGGCIISIQSRSITFPTSINLDGTVTVTSSRFPFI